jgi:predicted hydrolase (HD superfamily)
LPDSVYQTILAHNYDKLGEKYSPKNKMDWSLFICDSLTGLIVAVALVRPSKKLADVKLKSIKKKFKQPSFAAGTRREDIKLCEEKLGIPLDEFIHLSLEAMKRIADQLGL